MPGKMTVTCVIVICCTRHSSQNFCVPVCLRRGEREDQRKALTNMIRQYIKDKQASGFEGLYLLDLESTFDYYNLSPERRAQIFDDGIHMTKYGYELLGDKAYDGLVDAMGLQAPERARSSATTRKPVEHKSDKKVNDAQRQRQSMQKP